MTISLGSIEVGRCYLIRTEIGPRIARVLDITPDGRVHYELRRPGGGPYAAGPRQSTNGIGIFAHQAEREVSWDWTPEADQKQGMR
jgi:hypothetical protein